MPIKDDYGLGELVPETWLNEVGAAANDHEDRITALEALLSAAGTSWTPAATNVTLAAATGRYFRLGKLVLALFDLTWPATADTNGAVVTGLPLTVANSFGAQRGGAYFGYSTIGAAGVAAIPVAGGTTFQIRNAGGGHRTNADMSGTNIVGVVLYETT